jgi:hypothetical protein
LIRKLLREPLVHFLVLGAVVFAIFQFAADRSDVQEGKIVVTPGKIEQLVTGFAPGIDRRRDKSSMDSSRITSGTKCLSRGAGDGLTRTTPSSAGGCDRSSSF